MRLVRIFVPALLAVVAATAFVGASSASAFTTQLCLNDEALCGNPATHVHLTSTESSKLFSSLGTVECEVLFLSATVGALEQPQGITGRFSFAGCSSPTLGGCEASQVSGEAGMAVARSGIEAEKATATFSYEVLVQCGSFLHCVYSGEGLVAGWEGSLLSGRLTISEQETHKVSGFFCPTTAKLDLSLAPLTALYISE